VTRLLHLLPPNEAGVPLSGNTRLPLERRRGGSSPRCIGRLGGRSRLGRPPALRGGGRELLRLCAAQRVGRRIVGRGAVGDLGREELPHARLERGRGMR